MVVVKWILLIGLIGVSVWLIIDLTISIVKLVKKKKIAKKVHENIENNDKQ